MMRILIEPSSYHCRNAGDMAMLQVAVTRLRAFWPAACIQVITEEPAALSAACPDVQPLSPHGKRIWFQDRYLLSLLGRFHPLLPTPAAQRVRDLEFALRQRYPLLAKRMIQAKMRLFRLDTDHLRDFAEAVLRANLVVASGAGNLTDSFFPPGGITALDTLEVALRHGIPTALFGQGLGPIENPRLRARARAVLPRVSLIALREQRAGLPLLNALSVSPDRVLVTGDDAIEMAYAARPAQTGTAIGINLRVAAYAGVDQELIGGVQSVLRRVARLYDAPLLPVPISQHPLDSDARTIRQILAGCDQAAEGIDNLDTPRKVIEQVGRCRLVITGSYHAGVFALSQGLPIVGLAKSRYYADKFLGLANQFGTGCEVVFLDNPQMPEQLTDAIARAWQAAETVRPQLLAAAARQIESGRAAYQRVSELVSARSAARLPVGGSRPSRTWN